MGDAASSAWDLRSTPDVFGRLAAVTKLEALLPSTRPPVPSLAFLRFAVSSKTFGKSADTPTSPFFR